MPAPHDHQPGYYGWANRGTYRVANFIEGADTLGDAARAVVVAALHKRNRRGQPQDNAIAARDLRAWFAHTCPDFFHTAPDWEEANWSELAHYFAGDELD